MRPFVYGETWDAMTPRERRRALLGDIILAGLGAGLVFGLFAGWFF